MVPFSEDIQQTLHSPTHKLSLHNNSLFPPINTYILKMNPSPFPGFEGLDDFEELFGDETHDIFDSPIPEQIQTQEDHGQQESIVPQCLNQNPQPDSHSIADLGNHAADPVQLEMQSQLPPQVPCQDINVLHEPQNPHRDARSELQYLREMLRVLQSHAKCEDPDSQMLQGGIQSDPQVQTEVLPDLLPLQSEIQPELQPKLHPEQPGTFANEQTSMTQDSEIQDMLTQMLESPTLIENIPPLQVVPEFANPLLDSPPFELNNAGTEDMEVDEIRPNTPPEQPKQPKQQKPRRRKVQQSTNGNPHKRQRIANNKNQNPNAELVLGTMPNLDNSNLPKVIRTEARLKCPSCSSRFPDSHAVRRHFRMMHASTSKKSKICLECLQVCNTPFRLREHWKCAHEGELDFVCDECGARFSKNRNLSWHRTKLHSEKPKSPWQVKPAKTHECKFCDFTSDQKLGVVVHVFAAHQCEKDIECPVGCGKILQSMSAAKVHYFNCPHKSNKDR